MTDIQLIYAALRQAGMTETAALAMMGNWKCESMLDPFRKQGDLSAAALPSRQYVANVTNGTISKLAFASDQIGFGLAQWTYWNKSAGAGRKLDMYNFWQQSGLPLDSALMQTRFAIWELTHQSQYASLWSFLRTVGPDGLYNAVDRICRTYEQPAYNNVNERYNAAQELAARLDLNDTTVSDPDTSAPDPQPPLPAPYWPPRGAKGGREDPGLCKGMAGPDVLMLQAILDCRLFEIKADGVFEEMTEAKVRRFQAENGLAADGIVGPLTWRKLIEM